MQTLIQIAIANKQLVDFIYNYHQRLVEPHTFGLTRDLREVLSGFQRAGTCDSETMPGWKLFYLSEIRSLKLSDQTFNAPRTGYTYNDSRFASIYCQQNKVLG